MQLGEWVRKVERLPVGPGTALGVQLRAAEAGGLLIDETLSVEELGRFQKNRFQISGEKAVCSRPHTSVPPPEAALERRPQGSIWCWSGLRCESGTATQFMSEGQPI